jgi:diacylglycerol O-acyltransferase
MRSTDREIRQSRFMTDVEALMWSAERDPWLSSAMGSLFVLDDAPDFVRFRTSMERASKSLLRLRERVEEGLGVAPPRWEISPDFDIDDHVRLVQLPEPGGEQELLDLVAEVMQEPFAPNKPLWDFVAVRGSGSGGDDAVNGAIVMKLHHSVSDGIGAVRLAEMYLDLERNPPIVAGEDLPDPPADQADGRLGTALTELDYVARRQLGLARRTAAEVSLWGADPRRARVVVDQVGATVKTVVNQMVGSSPNPTVGSDLWRTRSHHRVLEVFQLPFAELQAAGKRLGASVNDVFVAGSVIGASTYHAAHDAEVNRFNVSFIMSTRNDDKAGGNSFAPIPFSVVVSPSIEAQVALVRAAIAEKRESGTSSESMELMASVANVLPSSLLTRAGRARTAKIDWATSSLRAAPFTLYVAGAEILHMYPIGPLGGTAFNLTAMTYNGRFDFGLFADPTAVDDPAVLRDHLRSAYEAIIEGGS